MAKNKNPLIEKMLENIVGITGENPEITGGGKGWTATAGEHTGKGTSKDEAIKALMLVVAKAETGFDEGDMSEGEIAKCVAECVESQRPYCECKCGGTNHGTGPNGLILVKGTFARQIGPKECLCGCGGLTDRTFVPGHDARYHAAQKTAAGAAAAGVGIDEYAAQRTAERKTAANAKAKARREARAALIKAHEARIAEAAAAGTLSN